MVFLPANKKRGNGLEMLKELSPYILMVLGVFFTFGRGSRGPFPLIEILGVLLFFSGLIIFIIFILKGKRN